MVCSAPIEPTLMSEWTALNTLVTRRNEHREVGWSVDLTTANRPMHHDTPSLDWPPSEFVPVPALNQRTFASLPAPDTQ